MIISLHIFAFLFALANPGFAMQSPLDSETYVNGDKLSFQGDKYPYEDPRLPSYIQPISYKIFLHPNITSLDVIGRVIITFLVSKETPFVILHSRNLTITHGSIKQGQGESEKMLKISKMFESEPLQQIYFEMSEGNFLFPDNTYTLELRFEGKIRTKEVTGFYRSSYTNAEGEKHFLVVTHFEPNDARTAFPCFDEPQMKAKFKMVIFREEGYKSLFNMPLNKTETVPYGDNQLFKDEFDESVLMSTYLVCFIVCDYGLIHNKTNKGVEVSIHTPKGLLHQASFALDSAVTLMEYFEEYFGLTYPLPKQDLVSIPDFGGGAMENWGLITYRETALLYDGNEGSSSAKQRVAAVVSHELAHQWFGNLVTMEWWNDLWLNEGFAKFVEYVGVAYLKEDWKMMDQFALDEAQRALHLDGLENSHPISVEVKDPRQIESIFDAISYSKGASVIRMLDVSLGEGVLRKGLQKYLNDHKFQNAKTDDLWAALTHTTNNAINVKTIMDTWTLQMGFPLVRVSLKDKTVHVTQEKFKMNPVPEASGKEAEPKAEAVPSWYIPLTYITDKEKQMQTVWVNQTMNHEFPFPEGAAWVKYNVNQTGFYRVYYEKDLWDTLVSAILANYEVVSPTDRGSLLDDAFTLTKARILSAQFPLELSQYLVKETEYVAWTSAIAHFRGWHQILYETPAHRLLLQYGLKMVDPIYRQVGWTDDGPHMTRLLRSVILGFAIHCEHQEAIAEAKKIFNDWMVKGTPIPPNIRSVVYSAGVKYGGIAEWQKCWSEYRKSQVASEKVILMRAMGSASQPWIISQYLDYSLDKEKVRSQDIRGVLGGLASNPAGRLLVWRFFRAHWDRYFELFGEGSFTMGSIIQAVLAHFATEFDFNEVKTFFNGRNVGSGERALKQSLETIRVNIQWVKENEKIIEDWLSNKLKN